MRTQFKLSHDYGKIDDLDGPGRDESWNYSAPDYLWELCADRMDDFFDIPARINDIVLVVSSARIDDAYSVRVHDGYLCIGYAEDRASADCEFVEIVEGHCKAGRDDYAYVWVEYDE